MTSSIDKDIEELIKDFTLDPNDSHVQQFLTRLNCHLSDYNPKGWTAFTYGSTPHGLATKGDEIDICITNIYSSTKAEKPLITIGTTAVQTVNASDNIDIVNIKRLASNLSYEFGKKEYKLIKEFTEAPVPFLKVSYKIYGLPIKYNISVSNTLDFERSHLIAEYLSLDNRIKPFLFVIKYFVKRRKINDEKNGYPSSYVYIMMGLYFLMFVQDPPVIPCLHSILDKTPCIYPACRSKTNKTVQELNITYHDCVNVDYYAASRDPLCGSGMIPYGAHWSQRNTKSVGELVIEAFRWFSYSAAFVEPRSINSKDPPVLQSEWEGNIMVFADVFDPKFNIAASCNAARVKNINQEFFAAYLKLKKGDSFATALTEADYPTRPVVTDLYEYTHGRPHIK